MNKRLPIAKVCVVLPVDRLFDYYIPDNLSGKVEIGKRVKIMFNKKNTIGYVISRSAKSNIKNLNPIIDTIDNSPVLSVFTLQLAEKIKNHYVCSLGEAIEAMLPNALKGSENIKTDFSFKERSLNKKKEGVTIYKQEFLKADTLNYCKEEIIKRIKSKKRVIFVVPEVEMINSVKEFFAETGNISIGIWHGRLSKNIMLNLWNGIADDKIDIIIGTRSAIFAPLMNLDLIVINDEDNYSYKDDQVPYYNAVEIARMRSEIEHCDVFLTSLIPTLKTYQLVLKKNIIFNDSLNTRPLVDVAIMGINYKDKIDIMLEKEIASVLERKEKILVFLNRKGFATFIYCKKCNEALRCSRCSSNLRFDYSKKLLICPSCSYKTEQVEICPKCNSAYVRYGGLGMERLESILKRNFPLAKINTIDELTKANAKEADSDIVISTTKILSLQTFKPDITIIWDLDSLLNIGDFSAGEKTFNLLSKLLLMTTKKMIICSSLNQEFYLLNSLPGLKFEEFYKSELKIRKELKLPPYYHLGLISLRGLDKKNVQNASLRLSSSLEKINHKNITLCNNYKNLRLQLRGKFYSYILVKSKTISLLNRILKNEMRNSRSNKVIITVNIDP